MSSVFESNQISDELKVALHDREILHYLSNILVSWSSLETQTNWATANEYLKCSITKERHLYIFFNLFCSLSNESLHLFVKKSCILISINQYKDKKWLYKLNYMNKLNRNAIARFGTRCILGFLNRSVYIGIQASHLSSSGHFKKHFEVLTIVLPPFESLNILWFW